MSGSASNTAAQTPSPTTALSLAAKGLHLSRRSALNTATYVRVIAATSACMPLATTNPAGSRETSVQVSGFQRRVLGVHVTKQAPDANFDVNGYISGYHGYRLARDAMCRWLNLRESRSNICRNSASGTAQHRLSTAIRHEPHALVAQRIEQLPSKQTVGGSTPSGGARQTPNR